MKSIKRKYLLNTNEIFSNALIDEKFIRLKNGSIELLTENKKLQLNKKTTVSSLDNIVKSSVEVVGVNQKFIGKRRIDGRIGIVKFPLGSKSYDCINEVICYHLGKLFGFDVAEATLEYYEDKPCVISCYSNNNIFEYNTIKSLKSCIDVNNFRSTFNMNWLLKNFGEEARIKFIQMLMFDYINCDIGV